MFAYSLWYENLAITNQSRFSWASSGTEFADANAKLFRSCGVHPPGVSVAEVTNIKR